MLLCRNFFPSLWHEKAQFIPPRLYFYAPPRISAALLDFVSKKRGRRGGGDSWNALSFPPFLPFPFLCGFCCYKSGRFLGDGEGRREERGVGLVDCLPLKVVHPACTPPPQQSGIFAPSFPYPKVDKSAISSVCSDRHPPSPFLFGQNSSLFQIPPPPLACLL